MTSSTCDVVIAELAEWIQVVHEGSTGNLVAKIATGESREKAANELLGQYGATSPKLQGMFARLVEPSSDQSRAIHLSALRGAMLSLAQGEYAEKIKKLDDAKSKNCGSSLSNLEGLVPVS